MTPLDFSIINRISYVEISSNKKNNKYLHPNFKEVKYFRLVKMKIF